MANEGYERAYRDALDVLQLRGKIVGKPAYSQDGLRYCRIDQVALGERDILEDAWGESLADEIIGELNGSFAHGCRECDRLLEKYADMMKRHVALVHSRKSLAQAGSDPMGRRVMEIRDRARQAVLDHTATHPRTQDCGAPRRPS